MQVLRRSEGRRTGHALAVIDVFFKENLGKYGFEGSKRNVVEGEDVLDFWVVDVREGERV